MKIFIRVIFDLAKKFIKESMLYKLEVWSLKDQCVTSQASSEERQHSVGHYGMHNFCSFKGRISQLLWIQFHDYFYSFKLNGEAEPRLFTRYYSYNF